MLSTQSKCYVYIIIKFSLHCKRKYLKTAYVQRGVENQIGWALEEVGGSPAALVIEVFVLRMLQEHRVTSIFHGALSNGSTLVLLLLFALLHFVGVTIGIFWEIALTSPDVVVKAGDAVKFLLDTVVALVEFSASKGMWEEPSSSGRTLKGFWEGKREISKIMVHVFKECTSCYNFSLLFPEERDLQFICQC